jgi:N-acylneuraminate cytidylyltransferase
MNRRAICVVPARGGSKRLPRKNVLLFHGKPMLAHSIAAAQASGCFERIVVSSEDDEVLTIADGFAVGIHRRDEALASDQARVVDVMLDVLDSEAAAGRDYDVLCCLYPTAPLRSAADVEAVVALVVPGKSDFALAVTDYDLPPHQALRLDSNQGLEPMFPDLVELRDEEVGKLVVDNGSTYAVSTPAFRAHKSFYGPGLKGHIMPRARSVDINLPDDLDLADYYFGRLRA